MTPQNLFVKSNNAYYSSNMPRPLRIEFKNAYYHVMNRGLGKQNIFHGKEYFEEFLSIIGSAHKRFGIEIICYCLMSNHYHLFIKTPEGNLGRAMRHIGGVYTQKYNYFKKTDGPLFRGRYKAILVEEGSYQLQLSRYIHRNPLEANVVENLRDYTWSSFTYFTSNEDGPEWLCPNEILEQFSPRPSAYNNYMKYLDMGNEEELKVFYTERNSPPYLGSDGFRSWIHTQHNDESEVTEKQKIHLRPDMDSIINQVAEKYGVTSRSILKSKRGKINIPRWVAMHDCQEQGGYRLIDIAKRFGIKRSGGVASIICKAKKFILTDKTT